MEPADRKGNTVEHVHVHVQLHMAIIWRDCWNASLWMMGGKFCQAMNKLS